VTAGLGMPGDWPPSSAILRDYPMHALSWDCDRTPAFQRRGASQPGHEMFWLQSGAILGKAEQH